MGIPKLTPEQWANIRIEREAGASFGFLSAKYGVSKTVIARRAEREGWSDGSDAAETVRRKAQEKLYELPDTAQKRAAAIEAAADRAAEIYAATKKKLTPSVSVSTPDSKRIAKLRRKNKSCWRLRI